MALSNILAQTKPDEAAETLREGIDYLKESDGVGIEQLYLALSNILAQTKPDEAAGFLREGIDYLKENDGRGIEQLYWRLGDVLAQTKPDEAAETLCEGIDYLKENGGRGIEQLYWRLGAVLAQTKPDEAAGFLREGIDYLKENDGVGIEQLYWRLSNILAQTKPDEAAETLREGIDYLKESDGVGVEQLYRRLSEISGETSPEDLDDLEAADRSCDETFEHHPIEASAHARAENHGDVPTTPIIPTAPSVLLDDEKPSGAIREGLIDGEVTKKRRIGSESDTNDPRRAEAMGPPQARPELPVAPMPSKSEHSVEPAMPTQTIRPSSQGMRRTGVVVVVVFIAVLTAVALLFWL